MAQEIEIKFALKDRRALVQKLREIGAQRLYEETFEDNIVLDRRGELRTRGALLRVRKFGRYAIATFKGPMAFEGGVKSREEVQTAVESFELAIQLFDALGFKPVFRYQKYREVWRIRDVEVVLDRTPIGDYFEIEGALDVIRSVATELGMNVEQGIRQSYADLYRQYRRTRADLPENMVFPPDQLPTP
ncbi:MAG TPA: class IV adenylate cyclase [Thermoanaerobaculia bacterium]|nr:class IV adenylate cyclase [Thermoanaerobaculia bacterium]